MTATLTRSAHIDAVIAAYEGGLSMDRVAFDMNTSSTQVHNILRRHSPGSIRSRGSAGKKHPRPPEDGLTLRALGLYRVGPCADCETPLVSLTQERGQACGFCQIARRT